MMILPPPGPWPMFMPRGGVSAKELKKLDRFLCWSGWFIAVMGFVVVGLNVALWTHLLGIW